MNPPLPAELEQKAQELAARIRSRSAEAILEMARRLVRCPDEQLFGDTEFALRDAALSRIPAADAEHLEKKVATSDRPSTAPTAEPRRGSTPTAARRSKRSAAPSPASGPTITAAPAAPEPPPGTVASDGATTAARLPSSGSPSCAGRWPIASRGARSCSARRPGFAGVNRPFRGPPRPPGSGSPITWSRAGRSARNAPGVGSATRRVGRSATSASMRRGYAHKESAAKGPTVGWPTGA
jgi:hypothetical protein